MERVIESEQLRIKRYRKAEKRKNRRSLARFRERQRQFDELSHSLQADELVVPGPLVFSVIKNRDATVRYFNHITKLLERKRYTAMDLSHCEYTDLPTICLLSAYMLDSDTPRYLRVTIPSSTSPTRQIWDDAQFAQMVVKHQEHNFTNGRFLSRSSQKLNEDHKRDILESTLQYFGTENMSKLSSLNAVISEIIENTALHADPFKENRKSYLINTRQSNSGSRKQVEFCVIDLGVGIYESVLKNVHYWNSDRIGKIKHRLTTALYEAESQSVFLATNIPAGIRSRTNEPSRGKGIKSVYKVAQNDIYDIFNIITNRAFVDLKRPSSVTKDTTSNLFGTIYYWRVCL